MSRQTFTRFLRNPTEKISLRNVQNGGGVIGRLTNVQKTTNLVTRGFPNAELETFSKFAAERLASSSIRFRLIGD